MVTAVFWLLLAKGDATEAGYHCTLNPCLVCRTALLIARFSVVEYLLPRIEYSIRPCGAVPQSHTALLDICADPPRDRTVVFCRSHVCSLMRIIAAKRGYTCPLTPPNRLYHNLCMPPRVSTVSSDKIDTTLR